MLSYSNDTVTVKAYNDEALPNSTFHTEVTLHDGTVEEISQDKTYERPWPILVQWWEFDEETGLGSFCKNSAIIEEAEGG